jgi:hypothetical protein
MIDTDKYEGHTPAPWSIKTGNAGHSVKDANGDHVCTIPDPTGMSNKHIIADAPLLLEAYKRLREALITMRDECDGFNDLGKRLHDFIRKERIE